MKAQITQMRLVEIVKIIFVVCFLVCCKPAENTINKNELEYDLINFMGYKNDVLNKTTLSYSDLSQKNLFTLDEISNRNYKNNWVSEIKPYVNFDTIFNSKQKELINKKFRSLKRIKLEKKKIENKDALSNNGNTVITFPFFQQNDKGELFGFVYRLSSPESILFIFIKTSKGWKEFAKMTLGIS